MVTDSRPSREHALELEADAELYPADRSEILLDAAAAWRAAGETERAAEIYRELAEVRDQHGLYAIIELVEHHLAHGEPDRADDLLRRLRRDPLLDDGHCMIAGELLEIRGDLAGAERWLGRGAAMLTEEQLDEMEASRAPDATVAGMLLNSRRRVRRALGRDPDMLDDLAPAEIPRDPDERMRHIDAALGVHGAAGQVPPKDPPRNAPCPCGSGRKFKRCCGAPAQPLG
ncbi:MULTISPECIES: SEC-C metal-binding domain-containing protein [Catenuloplanes]|uniref:Tetratricopeptide (TPR) repeat protein n=1 Tax=Catenuloplanes niger TaxID=587534 RepID=A0AAE3ZTP0_9ACTN|nr:SEC-C metal-binding domain-containing protein [Catenuloplanes niger]MDR7324545.1 tetratricopeptide (TPR) repeat protein [Catenuloplanes niger]